MPDIASLCQRARRIVEAPGEVIHEIVSSEDGLGYGEAVILLQESKPHVHFQTAEAYFMLEGSADVFITDDCGATRTTTLLPGKSLSIPIGSWHYAKSNSPSPACLIAITMPAWSSVDHITREDVEKGAKETRE